MAINEIFIPFPQNHGADRPPDERRGIVLKFISQLWNRGPEVLAAYRQGFSFPTAPLSKSGIDADSEDPEFPGRTPSEVRRLREQAVQARRELDRYEEVGRKDAKESLELALLLAEQHRQIVAELFADISDTRTAVVRAHERAVLAETAAGEALRSARGNAVMLGDGRRVYFTADGSKLFNEEDHEILDAGAIAEATERRVLSATTHEEFIQRRMEKVLAAETTTRFENALVTLDEIEAKLAKEPLTHDALLELRGEADQVLQSLPADAREEYDRLKAARQGERAISYRATDPAFESAPILHSEFQKAATATVTEETPNPNPQGTPVYRMAPEF